MTPFWLMVTMNEPIPIALLRPIRYSLVIRPCSQELSAVVLDTLFH